MNALYRFLAFWATLFLVSGCSLPSATEANLSYPTTPALEAPANIDWKKPGLAKELINLKEQVVLLSGGAQPIPPEVWSEMKVRYPWTKNIDRHVLIDQTALLRSPNAPVDCKGEDCLTFREFKGYSWVELAEPLAVDFIPSKTDILKPEPGHLVVKTIKKCQVLRYEKDLYQLSDNKGNAYAMHATENGPPNLNAHLPEGFTLQHLTLDTPLVITPFGESGDCYFNIVGDHLGQGYHQYQYGADRYPD
jgi:hypothetical protein